MIVTVWTSRVLFLMLLSCQYCDNKALESKEDVSLFDKTNMEYVGRNHQDQTMTSHERYKRQIVQPKAKGTPEEKLQPAPADKTAKTQEVEPQSSSTKVSNVKQTKDDQQGNQRPVVPNENQLGNQQPANQQGNPRPVVPNENQLGNLQRPVGSNENLLTNQRPVASNENHLGNQRPVVSNENQQGNPRPMVLNENVESVTPLSNTTTQAVQDTVSPLPAPNRTDQGEYVFSGDMDTATNFTTVLKQFHRNSVAQDATSATVCVSGILVLLFALILYSRMWQKRDQWLNMNLPGSQSHDEPQLPFDGMVPITPGRLAIKDLIDSKIKMIQMQFQKVKNSKRFRRLQKNGKYKRVEQRADSVDQSESEEEVFVR